MPLANPARFSQLDWPEGSVLFDRSTGDTHALEPLAIQVLSLPLSVRDNPAMAAQQLGVALTDIQATLEALHALALL